MSATFRIGWGDRLRGILTGRVRHVHAPRAPLVFRQSRGSCGMDHDAFGLEATANWMIRCFDDPRPTLTVEEPEGWQGMACPCCDSVVHLDRIHRPHPERIALWRSLRAIRAVAAAARLAPTAQRNPVTPDPDPPLVYATPRGGQWVVHCPYCGSEHVHAPTPGPRVAHCTGGESRQYVVRLAPPSAQRRDDT